MVAMDTRGSNNNRSSTVLDLFEGAVQQFECVRSDQGRENVKVQVQCNVHGIYSV